MWDFICDWLPIVAFISGTALGWLINALFERVRRKHLEKLYQNTSNANVALESQLLSKSKLEKDLGRTNSELEKLREEVKILSIPSAVDPKMHLKNKALRQKIKKLKSKPVVKVKPSDKTSLTEYQAFLGELEKSIKRAKKKSAANVPTDIVIAKKNSKAPKPDKKSTKKVDKNKIAKKSTKKKKGKKKSKGKYDFYKQKFSAKLSSSPAIILTEKERDLTYLYGISESIQDILNENSIFSFNDLSNTKIADLRGYLALAGEEYENIDPLNWPIQARIADKGQWEILDEYKSKMEM